MNMNFYHIGVDAGMIMICDKDYYKKYGYKFDERISKKRKVPNGKYSCYWNIPNTWNGNVEGDGILEVTSGEIIVSDPCYCIQDEGQDIWERFLNTTDFGQNPEPGTVIMESMGGDGEYSVYIKLDKIED